jgi:ubiquinone/menaquinone biosynthesis C-methylase UbiE
VDPRELIVERAGVQPGMTVLDVACGAGNATIPAAREGARVTGVDPSGGLLAMAREAAADAMVEIDYVEGGIEDLPFGDASFDRVLSVFGHMFAPNHERTAAELLRVCRPGGAIAVASWTPEGAVGRLLKLLPAADPSALLWGTEGHVRELLGEARVERLEYQWTGRSADPFTHFLVEGFGPLLGASDLEELSPAFRGFLERENLADDGTFRLVGEYVVAVVRA